MARYVLLIDISPAFAIIGGPTIGRVGSTYSYNFVAYGGIGSLKWKLAPGSTLPAGWSLSSSGVLSHGTLLAPQMFSFAVQVVDQSFTIVQNGFFVRVDNPL